MQLFTQTATDLEFVIFAMGQMSVGDSRYILCTLAEVNDFAFAVRTAYVGVANFAFRTCVDTDADDSNIVCIRRLA